MRRVIKFGDGIGICFSVFLGTLAVAYFSDKMEMMEAIKILYFTVITFTAIYFACGEKV